MISRSQVATPEQVGGVPRESVWLGDEQGVAFAQEAQALAECRAGRDAGGLFSERLRAAGGLEVAFWASELLGQADDDKVLVVALILYRSVQKQDILR